MQRKLGLAFDFDTKVVATYFVSLVLKTKYVMVLFALFHLKVAKLLSMQLIVSGMRNMC
jgi:hypothetical protein